ncbi:MAG: type I restriction-modification enzyme R subunit C-terminal domain-containing protein, partial [Anaerolineae bacterium]
DTCKVVITTIQRLYSMLRGEAEFDPEQEEISLFDQPVNPNARPKEVAYNSRIPIEYFDVIVTDECHRSIYNLWRQVLEYFDAFLIGMTATPSKQTFGFFKENLVMEYNRQRAELDGVNVGGQVYVIRTQITSDGSTIPTGFHVPKRDRKTREQWMEALDEEFVYTGQQLDQAVENPNQIRLVIRTFRERLFTEIFPERHIVPKTLIFAKDDSHAEAIVRIVREEFNQGNDFCQKITYRVDGKPDDLISAFRNNYDPRIAVTVDMIATGTDIKPLEILLFMRMVRSSQLFEQMQGRGVRVIAPTDLQVVTSDATTKDRFVIIDAVGVVDVPKLELPTLEREPTVGFAKLLDNLAAGDERDDTFITLAKRISRLRGKLTSRDEAELEKASGGFRLTDIAHILLDATELDQHIKAAKETTQSQDPPQEAVSRAEIQLKQQAADLLNPMVRKLLKEIQARDSVIIDEINIDTLQEAKFQDGEKAAKVVESFREFIERNRDEITALRILYSIPYKQQRLEWTHIKELAERLQQPPLNLTAEKVWTAYARVEPERVRMGQTKRLLTDLIALVRHGAGLDEELVPFQEQVRTRYGQWLESQAQAGRIFDAEQKAWLDAIAEHIGVNLTIELDDFNDGQFFEQGGVNRVISLFGDVGQVRVLLDDLNTALAA